MWIYFSSKQTRGDKMSKNPPIMMEHWEGNLLGDTQQHDSVCITIIYCIDIPVYYEGLWSVENMLDASLGLWCEESDQ